jgi:hypothetical protein
MRIARRVLQTLSVVAAICICAVWSPANAAGLDGSNTIICAFISATACENVSGCESTTPNDLNLPQFFRVDFKNKRIVVGDQTVEATKTGTGITSLQRLDGQLILQGVEIRAWNLVINESTGMMTLTASSGDEVFLLFGACTVP